MRTLGFISLVAASGHHRTRPKEVRGPKPPYIIVGVGVGVGVILIYIVVNIVVVVNNHSRAKEPL